VITLKKLTWSNCFSYGEDNTLQLDEHGLTQIIGTNGVGKSSIPLILEEVLYNKNSKNVKKADVANRYTGNGYKINLQFTVNDDEYEIDLQRKTSVKAKFFKNKEDISSHTATNTLKSIQEVIGIDFKTFSQLVYQNTNSSLQFLTATDTNRKKFLIELLNLDEYVSYFELFKKISKEASTEVTKIQSSLETIQKWLDGNKLEGMEVLPLLETSIETEEDEKVLGTLQAKLENISEANRKIIKNNHYRSNLKKLDIDKISQIPATGYISYDEWSTKLGSLRAKKKAAESILQKTEKLGNECHTCGQEIDESFKESIISEQKQIIADVRQQSVALLEKIEEAKENNNLWKEKTELQAQFEKLYASIDESLPEELYSEDSLQQEISQLAEDIQKKRKKIKTIQDENMRRERNNYKVEFIREERDKYLKELDGLEESLAEASKLASNLEVLKKAFSTNGLIAYKIENLVKELEELTNTYLAELSDGRFTLEFAVNNDKLNVIITDNGKEVDISSLSSGELARVNTSTLLSIRKLMSSISKSRLNVLFLDEVINVLDETGRERLVEVLVGEEDLNTYLVSHGWEHPLLYKVQVLKENNISRLE
jgi:DNA repair exonuclease SbcCD ATPase subunit